MVMQWAACVTGGIVAAFIVWCFLRDRTFDSGRRTGMRGMAVHYNLPIMRQTDWAGRDLISYDQGLTWWEL